MKESKVQKKFIPDTRLQALIDRRLQLVVDQKRHVLCDNAEFLVYHWSGKASTFAPATGEHADMSHRIEIGDHSARVDNGLPFQYTNDIPSKKEGFEYTPLNWAKDYAFFIDHSPAEVHPNESIVGEFHWQLDEARFFQYPEESQDNPY